VKSKLRKLVLKIVFAYALLFPSSGLIEEHKSIKEMEDEGEVHIGI
jgi:hypothetical protein